MMALAKQLTESGRFVALIVSVEVGAAFPHDPGKAELAILGTWRESAQFYLPTDLQPPPWVESAAGQQIQASLRVWAEASPRPLVIFIDEIDCRHSALPIEERLSTQLAIANNGRTVTVVRA